MPTYDPNLCSTASRPRTDGAQRSALTTRCCTARSTPPIRPAPPSKLFMALAGPRDRQSAPRGRRSTTSATSTPAATLSWHDKIGGHGMGPAASRSWWSCNTYYYQLATRPRHRGHRRFMAPSARRAQHRHRPDRRPPARTSPSGSVALQEGRRSSAGLAAERSRVASARATNAYTLPQLANALAALVSRGRLYRPHVVIRGRFFSTSGVPGRTEPPAPDSAAGCAPEGGARRWSTSTARAPATRVQGAPYAVGGKTGTVIGVFIASGPARRRGPRASACSDHSWFVVYALTENRRSRSQC